MSQFKHDLNKEQILGRFLDHHYHKANYCFSRIDDRSLQQKGVDLIMKASDGLTYKVDEKAQLHYLNTSLPTFALEIDYTKGGRLCEGWLFDPDKVTEVYAFIFNIHLKDDKTEMPDPDDIRSCEVVFVNRLKLLVELSALGLTYQACKAYSHRLRQAHADDRMQHAPGFIVQVSRQLQEEPVNIIVRKRFLEQVGDKLIIGP
ncbi:MAG TPA: hypothetical protein VK907_07540 [Phnomibacter sp.]|nr:hypothetical protein [Phnomibacter sp.]